MAQLVVSGRSGCIQNTGYNDHEHSRVSRFRNVGQCVQANSTSEPCIRVLVPTPARHPPGKTILFFCVKETCLQWHSKPFGPCKSLLLKATPTSRVRLQQRCLQRQGEPFVCASAKALSAETKRTLWAVREHRLQTQTNPLRLA